MTPDVTPGPRVYRLALDLVRQGRVQYLPRGAGFHVVPTDGDPTPLEDLTVLWELFIAGVIAPVRPEEIAGYERPRPVRVRRSRKPPAPPGARGSNTTVGDE